MPAGRHDRRASIESRQETTGSGGNSAYTWTGAGFRWVQIEDSGGGELYRAQKVDATIDAVLTLREQFAGLAPQTHRIVVDSRTFDIKAVLGKSDRTARRGQMVYCKEVVV